MKMTIQTLIDCWVTSDPFDTFNPPATEAEIRAAEAKIGSTLPLPLRELYRFSNGDWIFNLGFYRLAPNPLAPNPPQEFFGVTNANEKYIEWGWHIPQEIRLFATMGGSDVFGIWLPETNSQIFRHPIIEVGSMPGEDGCMGVAGTNLVSFLRGWSAYHLMDTEIDALTAVEDGEDADAPNRLKRLQTALEMLQVPQHLRTKPFYENYEERFGIDPMSDRGVDHHFSQLRKWADPLLPDPYGSSYGQRYTITDLKKLFGET